MVIVSIALLLLSCAKSPSTLTVSAAADLTDAFQEIGRRFTAQTGIPVKFNFGSTGQLAQQIQQGAPVDLFAAANVAFVEDLERNGRLLPETRKFYGQGRLAIWTRADSPLSLSRLDDLARPEVRRIAIANPQHAPYGLAARQALEAAGLWEKLSPKLVLAENVRQTLQYAETGDVEAALVALSLCREGQGRWTLVPAELHRPLDQALAVVKGSRHQKEALRFADFVTSEEGRAIMRQYGFAVPGEATKR